MTDPVMVKVGYDDRPCHGESDKMTDPVMVKVGYDRFRLGEREKMTDLPMVKMTGVVMIKGITLSG